MLNKKNLKIGDVILFGDKSILGFIIKKLTKGPYSHAAIYIGRGKIIESSWNGVMIEPLSKYKDYNIQEIYRSDKASTKELHAAVDWCTIQIGKKYDYFGLFGILSTILKRKEYNLWDDKDRYWCSELIGDAFFKAGIDIDIEQNTYKVSPNDLSRSLKHIK